MTVKLTLTMKKTFHQALRDAIEARHRWHLPAKIWLIGEPNELYFEAHPDTLRLGGDNEIFLELTGPQLEQLAAVDGTNSWDIEVNWLLDKALAQ